MQDLNSICSLIRQAIDEMERHGINQWDDIYPALSNLPQVVISILMVIVGIRMVIGKKKELDTTAEVDVKPIADIAQIEDKSLDSKEA